MSLKVRKLGKDQVQTVWKWEMQLTESESAAKRVKYNLV